MRKHLIIILGLGGLLAGCSPGQLMGPKLTKHIEFTVADPTATIDDATVQDSCAVFKQRLELADLEGFAVECADNQGQPIKVSLPESADETAIADLLTAQGRLEFIDPQGQYLPEGTTVCTTDSPQPPAARPEADCSTIFTTIAEDGEFLRDEFKLTTDQAGQPAMAFKLNESGGARLEKFTADNWMNPMSIVVDQVVISSPQINGTLPGEGIITFGTGTRATQETEAKQLLAKMKGDPLPIGWRLSE
jgi:preprotein translocase subunit SecD